MSSDRVKRACSILAALRQNLEGLRGYIHQAELINMYNCAIQLLEEDGHAMAEWRLSRRTIEELKAVELRVKIDTVLTYFSVADKQIGFDAHRA